VNQNTAEFSITPEQIETIRQKFDLQDALPLTEITLGSTNLVYSLGQKYILKIDSSETPDSNLAIEDALYKALPKTLPCPKVIGLDISREIIVYPYMIMNRLSGEPVDLIWKDLPTEQQISLSQQMGDLLGQIHTINTDAVRACLPQELFHGHNSFEEYFQARASNALKAIETADLLDQNTRTRLRGYFDKTSTQSGATNSLGLLHGTYNFRNILSDNGTITGIIDWEDARIDNPAEELGLVLFRFFPDQLGDAFLNAYTKHATLPDYFAEQYLRYPLLYYLNLLPEIPTWTKYPGKQKYFREITERIIKETIG
jgi:aminoglycoside phosphotransferase (APT) family kinase protein